MKIITALFFVLVFTNCTVKKNVENVIPVDLSKDYIEKFDFDIKNVIALETNEESLIGDVKEIKIHNNYIYVLDQAYGKALYVFDINGKYLNKTKYGKGPVELLDPWTFIVNDEHVYLFDQATFSLYVYDCTLNFIKKEHFDEIGLRTLCKGAGGEYVLYSQQPDFDQMKNGQPVLYDYLIYDNMLQNKIKQYIEIDNRLSSLTLIKPISTSDSTFVLSTNWDNIIYKLDDECVPKYFIDFGFRNVNENDIKAGIQDVFRKVRSGKRIGPLDRLIVTDNMISVSFFINNNIEFLVIDRETYEYTYSEYVNANSILPRLGIYEVVDDAILGLCDAKQFMKWDKLKSNKQTYDVKEHDNPIVFLMNISHK